MHILLFDNHDSFTWNLAHDLERAGAEVSVFRAGDVSRSVYSSNTNLRDFISGFDGVVLSPGPGMPSEAPMLMEILGTAIDQKKPILGVCLGLQAIVEHFGGELSNMDEVKHGRVTKVVWSEDGDEGKGLFKDLKSPFDVGLYHSWVTLEEELPEVLKIEARSEQGFIMALRHDSLPISGLQFHPESILTPDGRVILSNWLSELA
ncbi:MAG TPA: aminodeoxychorismate/anthranilate synthase component II [Flavobacteriales bacterium]|nr:aminodeoxychorismate/anthranilate synthase component II [Flavobacteriales bacterium]HIB76279.1 aminodeoxychorismate/anthranilate synthase component II [Flavobacteriales bacterium]HIO16736.1 aminodeoxychorismate/anthranilate synthase component II [Flavobacteriales bacterium]HIO60045.1 aminodeoxychorismate/anthranilate synthase component II [Flavobacteriales bacterium]